MRRICGRRDMRRATNEATWLVEWLVCRSCWVNGKASRNDDPLAEERWIRPSETCGQVADYR
jgi:hypothetical protein